MLSFICPTLIYVYKYLYVPIYNVKLTQIDKHGNQQDETKPPVENCAKEGDGYNNINDGGKDVENEITQECIDARCSSLDHSQHFPRFS